MEPWGTPSLTGYSCKDYPSRTTPSHLLLRKQEIRPNIWPEVPEDLSLHIQGTKRINDWRKAAKKFFSPKQCLKNEWSNSLHYYQRKSS